MSETRRPTLYATVVKRGGMVHPMYRAQSMSDWYWPNQTSRDPDIEAALRIARLEHATVVVYTNDPFKKPGPPLALTAEQAALFTNPPPLRDLWRAWRTPGARTEAIESTSEPQPTEPASAVPAPAAPAPMVPAAVRAQQSIATLDKRAALLALGEKRKATRWPGYACLGDYHDGFYECDFVSPYTTTAGNMDADIFVMLQDWSSHDDMSKELNLEAYDSKRYGYAPTWPTNVRLIELLRSHFGVELSDTYATNLFPFIKPNGVSSTIPLRDLVRAATEFALPQVQIVQPKLVICLGLATFNALRVANSMPPASYLSDAIEAPFNIESARVWCQAHTGARGQNNRGRDKVALDWAKMRRHQNEV